MAEFVSGLPLLSHPRVWEWVLKSCLAFKRILEEDARFEKNLIADGIPQILKSWDEEEDQACYCTLLHSVGKTESMSSFFFLPPSFVACFISISFIFHFAIFMGMWMVSDTYYNRSACVILDAVVFTFLYLSHSTCHTFMKYSFRCLLNKIERDSLENHATATVYTNIHRNQWINFSHIFNLEMCIDWVSFRRNNEK